MLSIHKRYFYREHLSLRGRTHQKNAHAGVTNHPERPISASRAPCQAGTPGPRQIRQTRRWCDKSSFTRGRSSHNVGKGHALSGALAMASAQKCGIDPQIVYDLRRKGHALSLRMIRYIPKVNDNLRGYRHTAAKTPHHMYRNAWKHLASRRVSFTSSPAPQRPRS